MLRRAIGRATTSVLGLILLAPVLALLPAAVLDIGPGPESRTRFSVFPLALAALDPLIWTSLWNSVAAAVIVAVGSLLIGGPLGGVVARFRSWGRPVLSASITAPAVVAPGLFALGLLGLFDPSGPRGIGSVVDSIVRAEGYSARMWPWLVWVWAALIQGVALVVLTTTSAYGRLHSFGQDAARLAGARPPRVWWTLTWPALRPSVVSAVYLVFMINLADPAAPLVLGLRRTLGFQMVATALGPDPFPRLAAIALIVLAITLAGRTLVWWRGRSLFDPDIAPGDDRDSHDRQTQIAAWPPSAVSFLILGCWSLLAWVPVGGLMRVGLARTAYPDNAHSLARLGIVDLLRRLTTDPAPRLLAHSALLGLGVVALLCLLAWRPSRGRGPAGAMARGWRSVVAFLAVLVPPLVAGAGVLALGRTAMLSSRFFAASLDWTRAGLWMERIGLAFDPFVFPELVLFVGACLAFLPRRLAIRLEPPGRDDASARRIDQIRIAGAGRGPAVWHVWRWARAIPLPTMVLWGTLVATAITPALVLAPTLASRPIGPGIVVLIDQPDDSRAQASTLALAAIVVDLLALGWASARVGRAGNLEAADLA
jgi:ABC-type Fe3+ transport system permease subunit